MTDNVGDALERARTLYAGREALVDGEQRWSYAELHRRVSALDAALDRLGLVAGDVVAVLTLNCAAHLVAWLGIPRSGRVLNPLNFRLSPAELQFILDDSGARLLLVDDAFRDLGCELAQRCASIEHLVCTGKTVPAGCLSFADLTNGEGKPRVLVDPEMVAGIFYTGGTTGLPKGVMLTHRNLTANAKQFLIVQQVSETDSYLHAAPMFHLADGAATLLATWVAARHVIMPAFDPERWMQVVSAEHVTVETLVPTMINLIVNHPSRRQYDLSSLRAIAYGASPIPATLLLEAMRLMPCEWRQAYGMTEASPIATILSPEDHRRGAAGEEPYATRLESAGRPILGVEAEVRRLDGTKADVGEPGEIWVRGPNIMKGYWNRPQETAAALDEEGWYHSGDVAYADEGGYLFVVDRAKDMIVSGGENVYSIEVEKAICAHPAVLECAVFGVPDQRWGERVHAVVVAKPGAPVDEAQIIAKCRTLIGGYKLPRSMEFRTEPLPKSGAGKILKRELRQPYWEGAVRDVS